MMKGFLQIFIVVGIVVLVGIVGGGYYFIQQQKIKNINSFEECAKVYPVMESYPARCATPDGRSFTQELSEEEKKKIIPPATSSADEISPSPSSTSKNQCGDGVCQEVACLAIGCPAPETPQNCPQDCK